LGARPEGRGAGAARRGARVRLQARPGRAGAGHGSARRRDTIVPLGEAMAAYVIGEIEVTDPASYEDYRKQVLATIQKYGGKFLARGGSVEALEGGWAPKRLVLLEFPSIDQLRKWYRSPEY